jgi:Domain of unknown function (DUF4124)
MLQTRMKLRLFKIWLSIPSYVFIAFVALGSLASSASAFAQVFRCVEDGEIVYSNQPSSAKKKNCVRVKAPAPPRAQISSEEPVRRLGRVSSDNSKPPLTPSPSAFPRIDAGTQKYRDNDRAAILDEERRKEASLLSDLKKEFNNGAPERRTDERDQQKYLERVDKLKQNILRTETNVKSLERELQSVR